MSKPLVDEIFKYMQCDFAALRAFGFSHSANCYKYQEDILEGKFKLLVRISKKGEVDAKIIDTDIDEEYTLHLVEGAQGLLVSSVRKACCDSLKRLAASCFKRSVFKSESARKLILHIKKTYGDEPQFLWERFPQCAIFRRRDSGKWYGVLMAISASKLGLDSDGDIEIINLRIAPDSASEAASKEGYFEAYHMNKKHWISLNLNSALPMREIYARVAYSFNAASKKKAQAPSRRGKGTALPHAET